ncbi:unnamed protein product [Clonostachys solani]|uniref:FAD-binding domain-containing protein n=1 Tax=Clonostachys solani TaxID=160281 RepID=A0A9N9ZKX0_9HYPO|nr:unnamed protein product [Clonostachys solani]
MEHTKDFKVIVVGGGVAGLTLALMLEKFDIDYVLLEARKEFAPQVGASIGMMPNGLLVLDQLGCYEDIEAKSLGYSFDDMHIRAPNGESLVCNRYMVSHLLKRHGYPMMFFDRQWLLQVLHNRVQYKDRLLVEHRVSRVKVSNSGVQVSTDNGKTFSGSIVLGVDGVYSNVRREMRRVANEVQPGYFPPADEDNATCNYQCIFGISKDVVGLPDNEQCLVTGEGRSFLVMSGPEQRVYWFFFNRIPEPKHGDEIPKYTRQDEAKLVKKSCHLPITEKVTFGDLYAKKISSTLTPLHEFVFQKWFFQRILLMGDSVHKPNPISAMGGNGAIETVTDFMNSLLELRDARKHGLQNLTTEEIAQLFAKVQETRMKRSEETIKNAHEMQSLFALEKPTLAKLAIQYMGSRLAPDDGMLQQLAGPVIGSTKLKQLPVPSRPRAMPFDHELPGQPKGTKHAVRLSTILTIYAILLLLVSFKGTSVMFNSITDKESRLSLLERAWSGRRTIVEGYQAATGDSMAKLQPIYLVSQLISPLLIYTIEGYRSSNFGSALVFPSIFTSGMLVFGISGIAPVHAILCSWNSHTTPVNRFVPLCVAKVLVPLLTAGYILPSLMMFLLPISSPGWEVYGVWKFPPLFFSSLTAIVVLAVRLWQLNKHSTVEGQEAINRELESYQNRDLPVLKSAYEYAFATQATAHLATLAYGHSLGLPLFGIDFTALGLNKGPLNSDIVLASLSILGYCLYAVWDLRRAGYIRTDQAIKASLCTISGSFVVGPGAAWAGLWSWRESIIADLSKA